MQLHLDRGSGLALHRQIETQIRGLIESGVLDAGSRLPPTRELAQTLGVNRATVTTAYDALVASGLVEATVGRGTEVLGRGAAPRPGVTVVPGSAPDWASVLASNIERRSAFADAFMPQDRTRGRLDFTSLVPDEQFFPVDRLRKCLDEVMRRDGASLLQYGPPAGYEPFRALLAHRMRLVGMQVDASDVLVVNGAQQGLDLFCRALLDPGDAVAVESPTYGNLLPVLRLHRAEGIPVPMTPEGVDLDALAQVLATRRVKFLYTMPHFQNPTGITSTPLHRKRLLELAARHALTILEDGYEEDLRWDGGEMLPLRALDTTGRVCYLGTFSKGLVPGFRVGWLVAHRDLLGYLAALKRNTDYHTSLVLQAALAEFCRRGDYDAHLRRLRRTYRTRMQAAQRAFETHLPATARWRVPQGGYCLWVELPDRVDFDELDARLRHDGVHVTAGRHFFLGEPPYGCFRMSISRVDVDGIESGIAIVGKHLREMIRAESRPAPRAARPYV